MLYEVITVVARNLIDFPKIYPDVKNVTGQLGFGLNSAGECIKLFNAAGVLQDQVCYANEYPWPTEANGQGFTLSLKSPSADNTLGANWNASRYVNGTLV